MRIAQICCTADPRRGGMGRSVLLHARAMARAGHEVRVYALPPMPPREADILFYQIHSLFRAGYAAWGARFTPSLADCDIIHLHLPFFGVASRVASLKKTMPRTPLVATYHMDALGQGFKRLYFREWYRRRLPEVLRACSAVACTSRAYAESGELAAYVATEFLREIPLCVDTSVFYPTEDAGEPQGYVLFVGALDRAHYFKGVPLLLSALRHVQARAVVVGDGNLRASYERLARRLRVDGRVRFEGRVTDEQLRFFYQRAAVLVLPSVDRSEAFGTVLLEAFACGTPVVASDLPGVRETVQSVRGGMLSAPGNREALVSALHSMMQHPLTRTERAALAERTARQFGTAALAERLNAWYTSVR